MHVFVCFVGTKERAGKGALGVGGQTIIPVAMEHKVGNERWRKCFLKCQQKGGKKKRDRKKERRVSRTNGKVKEGKEGRKEEYKERMN